MPAPAPRSILEALTKPRLAAVGRELGVALPASGTKEAQLEALASSSGARPPRFAPLAGTRRAARRLPGARPRRLGALPPRPPGPTPGGRGSPGGPRRAPRLAFPGAPPRPARGGRHRPGPPPAVPRRGGSGAAVRARPTASSSSASTTTPRGGRLEVLWELELGARVLQPEAHGLGAVGRLDPPRAFAAYLHALRWNAVTATDARLFQAPFRAGIKLLDPPADAAQEGPRAAARQPVHRRRRRPRQDDRGRPRAPGAPPAPAGRLRARRLPGRGLPPVARRDGAPLRPPLRGLQPRLRRPPPPGARLRVNPWTTHNRFIVSHQLLRRPEVPRSPAPALTSAGRPRAQEPAHPRRGPQRGPAPAPALRGRLAASPESIRDLAPRFEHRLFLSATPHNGHSNSFSPCSRSSTRSASLRGVPVERRRSSTR